MSRFNTDVRDELRLDPALSNITTEYFSWTQYGAIERFIRNQPPETSVRLVGHSYGGDTAAKVAANLGRDGLAVDMLVTVDPVSNDRGDRQDVIQAARAGARRWINVQATGGSLQDRDNFIAFIGGNWGRAAHAVADEFLEAPVTHRNFGGMMGARLAGGATLREDVLGIQPSRAPQ